MRIIGQIITTVVLALPTPVLAQTVTPANLVGTWVASLSWKSDSGQQMTEVDTLILRADSTRYKSIHGCCIGKEGFEARTSADTSKFNMVSDGAYWSLSGDTLWIGFGRKTDNDKIPYRITFQDQQFTLEKFDPKKGYVGFSHAEEVYKPAKKMMARWSMSTDPCRRSVLFYEGALSSAPVPDPI